jgi:hypothetical protein
MNPKPHSSRTRPFREALRMDVLATGDDFKRLRNVARALLDKAEAGDVPAIREVADRLDGRVPLAVAPDDSDDIPSEVTVAWQKDS